MPQPHGEPEISQLQVHVGDLQVGVSSGPGGWEFEGLEGLRDEDVFGLDVSVYHAVVVAVPEGQQDLPADSEGQERATEDNKG